MTDRPFGSSTAKVARAPKRPPSRGEDERPLDLDSVVERERTRARNRGGSGEAEVERGARGGAVVTQRPATEDLEDK